MPVPPQIMLIWSQALVRQPLRVHACASPLAKRGPEKGRATDLFLARKGILRFYVEWNVLESDQSANLQIVQPLRHYALLIYLDHQIKGPLLLVGAGRCIGPDGGLARVVIALNKQTRTHGQVQGYVFRKPKGKDFGVVVVRFHADERHLVEFGGEKARGATLQGRVWHDSLGHQAQHSLQECNHNVALPTGPARRQQATRRERQTEPATAWARAREREALRSWLGTTGGIGHTDTDLTGEPWCWRRHPTATWRASFWMAGECNLPLPRQFGLRAGPRGPPSDISAHRTHSFPFRRRASAAPTSRRAAESCMSGRRPGVAGLARCCGDGPTRAPRPMAKPRTVISIVAMTVARRSAAIFEQFRLLLVSANFGRILSSSGPAVFRPAGRTHLFLWAATGRETTSKRASARAGPRRRGPQRRVQGDLEGAAE